MSKSWVTTRGQYDYIVPKIWELDENQAILTTKQTNVFISYDQYQYVISGEHLEPWFSE